MGESTIRDRGVARWLAALALLLVAACGSGDAGEPPVNADDVMFVQMMVQHHRQGIEMAGVGAERATTEELKTLAAAIVSTQQSEVEMMLRWLHAWGQPITPPDGAHDHHGGLPETDRKKIAALRSAKPFEPELLRLLLAHQDGAVQMAAQEVRDGVNHEATRWAAQVQESRKAQIEQMRQLLTEVAG
ncbi:DUF305 domain-containing protein [Nonomuraea harbinensis]|uniref:DUF305 domain-containing protein n=1 Tax=Nonomuraea harbinensis TaxID=1286938 RepID=A0ABW1BLG0_9ACTN|nr:DUF305 domain-containing protein [Nonomuraea harbinensis]